MSRALVLNLALYALVIGGLAALSGALLTLALPLLVYLGAALLARPGEVALHAVRSLGAERASPGAPVAVRLTVTNQGDRPLDLLLEDRLPDGLELAEGRPSLRAVLAPGASTELAYAVRGTRGLYRFAAASAAVTDPLGLHARTLELPAPGHLFVLPALTRLRRLDIRPRRTRSIAGLIPARQGGPGVEFFGVREYQPGDPTRWINARVTARFPQALFVNEFEQERAADVGIILDARLASDAGGGGVFEHAVEAAAALADALLERGNRVGLVVYGRALDWTFPGYGKLQRERIMRSLARAEQGDHMAFESLDNLPTRQFPARSQLILVSPLQPDDIHTLTYLRARDYQVLVVSPDPVAFERRALPPGPQAELAARLASLERDLLLRRVRALGVRLLDWDVAVPFQQAAAQALGRAPVPR
ncbi:MAG TPA: DUF58 domain-containing protein [Roseiflexaceae bacterium]|nr:DUF58 domain-containing protein [Roseiflexaceae bacterium]